MGKSKKKQRSQPNGRANGRVKLVTASRPDAPRRNANPNSAGPRDAAHLSKPVRRFASIPVLTSLGWRNPLEVSAPRRVKYKSQIKKLDRGRPIDDGDANPQRGAG